MMTWTNILKKACNLCFLGAVAGFLLLNTSVVQAASCKNGVIFVGDSRTVQMSGFGGNSVNKKDSSGNYWIAQVGAGLSWFTSTAVSQVNAVIKDYGTIIINLGVNDINNAQAYISAINTQAQKWIAQGKKVTFSGVLPVCSNYRYNQGALSMNQSISQFNNALQKGLSGVSFISTSSVSIQDTDCDAEGLHFNKKGSTVYSRLKSTLINAACSGGEGQKSTTQAPANTSGSSSGSATSPEEDCDLLSTDLKTCNAACDKHYPMVNTANVSCKEKCSKNSYDYQANSKYKECIAKQATTAQAKPSVTSDVALSGKQNCNSSNSHQSYVPNNTCATVEKMRNSGSRSALSNKGTECSTAASSCNSAAVQSVSTYHDKGNNSCFQGMPVSSGNISSVVGMRPVEIGARSSSCVLDTDTGIKMRQHQGMDVGTGCGTPIEAPADGVIELTRTNFGDGSGKWIKIRHDMNPNSIDAQTGCNYYYTVFYHLSEISKTGKVKKGETVGKVGNGGGVYSCHMHMEVHKCTPQGELLNPLCSNNENLCNDKAGVSARPENPIGAITSNNGVVTNPHLNEREDCDLFDLPECQKEPKDAKCPTKTKTKEECEERNAKIETGGKYCITVAPGEGKPDVAGSCIVKTADNSSPCNESTKQQTLSKEITDAIDEAAKTYGVAPTFISAIINLESAFNPSAQNSTTTAAGLGQILESSWSNKYFSCNEYGTFNQAKYNVRSNVMCMGKILNSERARLSKKFGNLYDDDLLIYAYFQGPVAEEAVEKYGANWKDHLVSATSTNTSGSDYLRITHCHMNHIATNNGCASQGGQVCEDFGFTDGYGSSGSLFDQLNGDNMANFDAAYQCSIANISNTVDGCLFCDIFKTIFNASSKVARQCHETFSSSLVTLVAIGLAISLAYMIMPYLANMTVQDPYKLVNDIIQRIFIVLVVILLLKMNVADFFDMFITPIFATGMKLAQLAISTESGKDIVSIYTFDNIDNSGLPKDMATSMLSAIYAVQVRLEQLWALGSNSVCIAFFVRSFHHYPIFPHFGYLLTGVFMLVTAVVFMLIYPFLLIDAVLQFAIASSLMPLAIAATAFKTTRQYLNLMKILSIFMNAMFIFIFLTIVMFILLSGIDEAVRPHIEKAYKEANTGGLFEIREIGWYTQTFIKLIFFLFLGKAVLDDIPNFAQQFGEAFSYGQSFGKPDMGIGRKIGGTAAGAATNVATTVAGTAWKGTKAVGRGAKSFIGAAASEGRRTYLINKTRRKASALAATAAAGTATAAGAAWVSGRTWYGRKVQRRVTTDAQGNAVLESRKRSLIGNKRIINQDDGNMSITKKMNKDGSMTETYNIKTPYGKNLINADGTKNKEAIDYLMQNSGLGKDAVNKIMLNQLIKERLPGVKRGMGKEFFRDNSFTSEEIYSSVDDKGREVFEVRRVGKDGYVNVFRMTKGETRDLVEFERIDKNGNAKKWASDGVIQMKMGYKYEVDGNGMPVLNEDGTFKRKDGENDFCEFSNTKAYKGVKIFDSNGQRAPGMENEELMFSDTDLQSYRYQMDRYGDVLKHTSFGK